LSKAIQPAALTLTRVRADIVLWYIHFLACFIGLALLPFTKFFHILTSPLVLLINGVMDRSRADPANVATAQAIELDACTHCATCTQHCSVLPIYRLIPNPTILPSEKLAAFRSIAQGKETDARALARFQEGASICTGCYRGTIFCPVGIVAQELWFCMREDLAHLGCPDLFVTTRDRFIERFDWDKTKPLTPLTRQGKVFKGIIGESWQGSSFSSCYTCMTCSNVCPVVRQYSNPIPELGLLPHQIMYSLKFGLQEKTLGARMVWDCLGCYQCQEGCPQGVRVADILFELKNAAFQESKAPFPERRPPRGC
jgi:heterodisulfide reductase subunit C